MEELQKIYGLRERCDEYVHDVRKGQKLKNSYTLNGLNRHQIPAGDEGTVNIDGLGETIDYTIDKVNNKALLRLSHSFEEIDQMLEQAQG